MRLKFSLRKILSVIATLATLGNSIAAPATVLAQVASPSPTPLASPEPTVEAGTPTASATVAPTESPTAEPSATPTIVATPSAVVTPLGSPESSTEAATPDSQTTQDQSQTTNESAQSQAPPEETVTPTPTITPVQPEPEGNLTTTVAQNVDLSQINLLNSNVDTATVTTDKADYSPTDVVLITGTGFTPEKAYTIEIVSTDPPPVDFTDSVTADTQGSFIYSYQLDGNYRPNYTIYVKDGVFTVASTTFTDSSPNPDINLDQCRNGSALSPSDCLDSGGSLGWVNGNAGSSDSHYVEGYSIPYRAIMTNLPTATSITVNLGYDITHSSHDAIDYLTQYDRLEPHTPFGHPAETVTPTDGVSGISATTSTYAIPAPSSAGSPVAGEPTDSFNSLPANERVMTLFGGTITNVAYVSQGNLSDAQAETVISVTFSVDNPNAVLAWGGHIASRLDWGYDASNVPLSAGGISGSPYHMRLDSWTLSNLGNTDKSLSAGAVIPPGNLTIIKDVVPDDSGATSWDFLTTGPNSYSHNTTGLTDGGIDVLSIPPGTYDISELTDPSYSTTVLCTTGESGTSSVSVTVNSSEDVSCTFTNTLQKAHLTLVKEVTNDNGGTALPTAWTLSASGPTPISGSTGDPSITNAEVTNGTYSLSESGGASGYSAGSWSCTGDGSQKGSDITLAPGDSATCTIINNDIAPQLIVIKHVINDNGGTAVASNFTMNVTATNPSQSSFAGAESPGTTITLDAGSYSVDEDNYVGYTKTIGTDCSGTIAVGESKTCTITNDDNEPQLHLRKTITNDDGGTEPASAWTLTATGTGGSPTNLSGSTPVDSSTGFKADTYALGESGPSNYTAGAWDCGQAAMTDSTHVVVPLGGDVTCTINNDDNAPSLKLVKTVTNDDGGTAVPNDWTLDAKRLCFFGDTSGTCNISNLGGSGTFEKVRAGLVYTLSENGPSGYTAGSWSCTGGVQNANKITLGLGDQVTCTINNDDVAPTLKLVKNVVGGDSTAGDWTLYARTLCAFGDTNPACGFSYPGDTGTFETLAANKAYKLYETGPSDYTAGSWSCDGGTLNGNTVTLDLAEEVTCEITNTRDLGSVKVNKLLDGDGNGTFETLNPGTFNWSLDGNGPNVMGQTVSGVETGSHNVSENNVTDYHFVGWYLGDPSENQYSCSNLPRTSSTTLPISVEVTKDTTTQVNLCNARDTGDLKVNKLQDDTGNGSYGNPNSQDFSWGTVLGTTNYAMGSSQALITGNYDVYESGPNSYKFTGWFYGDPQENEFSCLEPEYTTDPTNIAVTYGQETEITLCNQYQNPKVSISKSNDSGSGISAGNTVTYTLSVTNPGNINFYNVLVTDVLPAGFKYVDGSTTGATLVLPQVNPLLKWNLGTLDAGQTKIITYQATTDSNLSDGTYTNFANCAAYFDGKGSPEPCEQVNSDVTIGSGVSFGGNLGQVLGISTELPATGSPTLLFTFSLGMLGLGLFLKGYNARKTGKKSPFAKSYGGTRHAKN